MKKFIGTIMLLVGAFSVLLGFSIEAKTSIHEISQILIFMCSIQLFGFGALLLSYESPK